MAGDSRKFHQDGLARGNLTALVIWPMSNVPRRYERGAVFAGFREDEAVGVITSLVRRTRRRLVSVRLVFN